MKDRPEELPGRTICKETGCGNVYVTVSEHHGKPVELFATLGKAGGCGSALLQAVARVTSIALQGGTSKKKIIATLAGMNCPVSQTNDNKCCVNQVARALELAGELIKEGIKEESKDA